VNGNPRKGAGCLCSAPEEIQKILQVLPFGRQSGRDIPSRKPLFLRGIHGYIQKPIEDVDHHKPFKGKSIRFIHVCLFHESSHVNGDIK